MPSLLLASQSPRRKELLEQSGFSFHTQVSNASEEVDPGVPPSKTVEELALRKAEKVFSQNENETVLGADTIVVSDNTILGKPADEKEAREMLRKLSNHSHHVYSGTAILSKDVRKVFHVKTEVVFYQLQEDLIESYLKTEEPYDKAGAYGIQGKGRLFVKAIHGDYFNVVGLPIARVARELEACNIFPSFRQH
ncbi:Maf family protein [Alteribacillus bidgolensis]|uniref:dTTP/UTP pyrophosphatase n=1 Tax=Alteribacillus bidgolensis TaxID=930129 RepID=A0A1G8MSV4_9BACI|nr:Maf family protein [Alteribacillus bidgolensis]SDI70390.1 septum formation protein [Alteribacillus bidgolensis]